MKGRREGGYTRKGRGREGRGDIRTKEGKKQYECRERILLKGEGKEGKKDGGCTRNGDEGN